MDQDMPGTVTLGNRRLDACAHLQVGAQQDSDAERWLKQV